MSKRMSAPDGKKKRPRKRVVWRTFWNADCPGAGAGEEVVYERDGLYSYRERESGESYGPTRSLKRLLKKSGLTLLLGAEVRIDSPLFTAAEIAGMLTWDLHTEPLEGWSDLLINGEGWAWTPAGGWQTEADYLRAGVSEEEAALHRQFLVDVDEPDGR